MYSTKTAITLSLKQILEILDDYSIYAYYLGRFQIGKLMNSPLRTNDQIPSFAIFRSPSGDLLFKDHGTGESGNVITFVKLLKGIQTKNELERELFKIVKSINPNMKLATSQSTKRVEHGVANIGIVRQAFTETDKRFWKQFGIHIDTLKKFRVFSIKHFLCNDIVKATYKENDPLYAFKVNDHFKIYRPLTSKYNKWRSNTNINDIQGLSELPKKGGELLIITKSLKDVMCLYEMGYYAISPSSETTFVPENILKSLRSKWKHIVILYDRDKTGMLKSREYSKQYKLDAIFINKKFHAKDVSDAVKNNSFEEIKNWLTKTLEVCVT